MKMSIIWICYTIYVFMMWQCEILVAIFVWFCLLLPILIVFSKHELCVEYLRFTVLHVEFYFDTDVKMRASCSLWIGVFWNLLLQVFVVVCVCCESCHNVVISWSSVSFIAGTDLRRYATTVQRRFERGAQRPLVLKLSFFSCQTFGHAAQHIWSGGPL